MNRLWEMRTPRERGMIVFCLIVALGSWLFNRISPNSAEKRLLPAAQAHLKYDETMSQMRTMSAENTRLKPEIEKMIYSKTPDQLVPLVIRTLQKYARDSGIHLREIKPLHVQRLGALTEVPVDVRFSTNAFKGSVIPFLYRLEDPQGKLVVEKFNMTAADPKTRMVDIELQVALFTRNSAGGTL